MDHRIKKVTAPLLEDAEFVLKIIDKVHSLDDPVFTIALAEANIKKEDAIILFMEGFPYIYKKIKK